MSAPAPEALLAAAGIHQDVLSAHPAYVAVLITATGLVPGGPSSNSERLLQEAEVFATDLLQAGDLGEVPQIAAWRGAYQSFGVRPRQARSSVEALARRATSGLPRIDRLTDTYNAISVLHLMPIGGEDLRAYAGGPTLTLATGQETFDTTADGEPVMDHPTPGEVIWRDNVGVTCRRWNWRQCTRTRLTTSTTDALFIIDGLGTDARTRALECAESLIEHLLRDSPDARVAIRALPE